MTMGNVGLYLMGLTKDIVIISQICYHLGSPTLDVTDLNRALSKKNNNCDPTN